MIYIKSQIKQLKESWKIGIVVSLYIHVYVGVTLKFSDMSLGGGHFNVYEIDHVWHEMSGDIW